MGERLKGKVALITGGTSGIGEATVELFVREGAKVVFVGRSEEKGQAIAERLGGNALYGRADVSREEDIAESIDLTIRTFGKLDILFNNAGSGGYNGPLEAIEAKHIEDGVRVLLSSVILGIRYAIEPMKRNGGGSIINDSSMAAIRSGQGPILYAALKAAVTHYTKLAGVELGPHNIRVNAISPAAVATPIFWGGSERANTLSAADNAVKMEKLTKNLAKATPLPYSGYSEDVAEAAVYLASDAGRFVNCHDLVVDGGRSSMFYERP